MPSPNIGILYVDDEPQSLRYFQEIFEDIAKVYVAEDGYEGFDIYKKHRSEIGIVISDLVMPGINGYEFLEQVRVLDDGPIRMLVTAHKDLDSAVDALNDGLINTYLIKPWNPKELVTRIKRALDRVWIQKEKGRLLRDRAGSFQELMMVEKASSIETLFIGLNHHIRNSLAGVQSYLEAVPVKLEKELGGEIAKDKFFWGEYHQQVEEQLEQTLSIINGINQVSQEEEGGTQLDISTGINVAEIIGEVGRAETRDYTNVSFEVNGDSDISVTGDQAKLLRLFSGLFRESLQNINDRSDGGIEVYLEKSHFSDGTGAISIKFSDNGMPLPDDERSKLFDPFFIRSDRPKDTGVGLLACYLIVYQHGGKITAHCINQKNVINVVLPLVAGRGSNPQKIIDDISQG